MPREDSGGVTWTSTYRMKGGEETINGMAHRNSEGTEVEHSGNSNFATDCAGSLPFAPPDPLSAPPHPGRLTYMDDTSGLLCPLLLFGFSQCGRPRVYRMRDKSEGWIFILRLAPCFIPPPNVTATLRSPLQATTSPGSRNCPLPRQA